MNTQIKLSDLTNLEQQVIEAIKRVDNPEYFTVNDIFYNTPMDKKIVRGTLSSLVKKNIIFIDTEEGGLVSIFEKHLFE